MARFEASRNRLASLAYRLLGSAADADAEDTVQDAFLRWQAADREYVEVPEAWLTKIVTNLALSNTPTEPGAESPSLATELTSTMPPHAESSRRSSMPPPRAGPNGWWRC